MLTLSKLKSAIRDSDKETVRNVLDNFDEDVLEAALDCGVQLEDIAETYQGKHDSDADFAEQLLTDTGDIPKLPSYVYID